MASMNGALTVQVLIANTAFYILGPAGMAAGHESPIREHAVPR